MSSRVKLFLNLHGSSMSGVSDSDSSTFSGPGPSRRLAYPKTSMEVRLDNHFQAKVYNSGDTITGKVTIAPLRDIPFDLFEIVLLGTTQTRIDHISSPVHSSHTFLKLYMPIPESAYPVPRMLETGKTYTLPIHYVVPHHLTLSACNHKVSSPQIHEHHVMLPPTMGCFGNNTGSNGSRGATAAWERDDMAPEMANVEYCIKARIYRETPKDDGSGKNTHTKIVEASHPLRILPSTLVDPPLSISKADRAYKLQTSKSVRKGLFARSKLGTVTATTGDAISTPQPAPIVLRPDGITATATKARIQLYFDPARPDIPPPHVTAMSAKLTAHTHFSTTAISSFPNMGDWARSDNSVLERRGTYAMSVPLASQSLKNHKWDARVDSARRDSGYCSTDGSDELPAPASGRRASPSGSPGSSSSSIAYASILDLDIELPMHKRTFLPTFHSCITSRTYSLQVTVSMVPASSTSSSSTSGPVSTVTLSMPLQIVVGDAISLGLANEDTAGLPSFEDVLEEAEAAEADAHLQPRVLAVPDTQYQQTSTLPGYST